MSDTQPSDSAPPESITFTAFILSLSSAALQHLGLAPSAPGSTDRMINLPLAQQTIDILAMLQQKSKDNLTDEESKLLGNILYDLRMRYVEKVREAGD